MLTIETVVGLGRGPATLVDVTAPVLVEPTEFPEPMAPLMGTTEYVARGAKTCGGPGLDPSCSRGSVWDGAARADITTRTWPVQWKRIVEGRGGGEYGVNSKQATSGGGGLWKVMLQQERIAVSAR